jgi:hypothetical protein
MQHARTSDMVAYVAPPPNAALLGVLLCLPSAPTLLIRVSGDFDTSPLFGQLRQAKRFTVRGRYSVLDPVSPVSNVRFVPGHDI